MPMTEEERFSAHVGLALFGAKIGNGLTFDEIADQVGIPAMGVEACMRALLDGNARSTREIGLIADACGVRLVLQLEDKPGQGAA